MSELEHFETVGDHAEYRPSGQVSLAEAVQLVGSAITLARERQLRNLLVVTTGLTGFEPPNIVDRYFFIKEWAVAADRFVRLAMVARREMIDPQKFGVTVAANNGLVAEIFESEEGALAWLKKLA
jgi:hypothetical protein